MCLTNIGTILDLNIATCSINKIESVIITLNCSFDREIDFRRSVPACSEIAPASVVEISQCAAIE